jgi:hypothetical protein
MKVLRKITDALIIASTSDIMTAYNKELALIMIYHFASRFVSPCLYFLLVPELFFEPGLVFWGLFECNAIVVFGSVFFGAS